LRDFANEAAVGAYSPMDGDFTIVLGRVGTGDFEVGTAGALGLVEGVLERLGVAVEGVFARAAARDDDWSPP
jgi:hypothetical protein